MKKPKKKKKRKPDRVIAKKLISILEKTIDKLTSGRFIATIVICYVYAFLSLKGVIESSRIIEITVIVLYSYFSRGDRKNGN